MISTIFYTLIKPQPFVEKILENHQEINALVDEIARSQLKGFTLSCVVIDEKGYTLKARKLEWYEPFTSLFWVSLNEDKTQIQKLADSIVLANIKRLFTQNCTLLKDILSPKCKRVLEDRLSKIANLNQKLEAYKPIRKPLKQISPKDPQTGSLLLSISPLKDLFPHIFSYVNGEDLNAFQRTSQEALARTQKKNSAMHVLKRFIYHPSTFPLDKLGPDFRLSRKDKKWISKNSHKISKLFEVCPSLGDKPDHLEFFKNVLLQINKGVLEHTKISNSALKKFRHDCLDAHNKLLDYAEKIAPLTDIANIDWGLLAPALSSFKFYIGDNVQNFIINFAKRLSQEDLNGCKNLEYILLFVAPHIESRDVIKLCPEKLLLNKEFAAKLCKIHPSIFELLPNEVKYTEEVLLAWLSLGSNHIYFENLPNKFKEDRAFILKALEINPDILQYLDADSITFEQALVAVTRNGSVFTSHVPYRFRKDPIILERAMSTFPLALIKASENLQKDPYFLKLVIYNSDQMNLKPILSSKPFQVDSAFTRLFVEANNPSLLIEAIEKGLDYLNPYDFEIAKAYLKRNPSSFNYLSSQHKHIKAFWLAAVILQPSRYRLVPEEYKAVWFDEAFSKNREVLVYSPYNEDPDRWKEAIAAGLSLKLAPPSITSNPELVLQAVIRDGKELQFASEYLKNNESIVAYAALQDKENLQFADTNFQNNKPFEEYLERFNFTTEPPSPQR